MNEDHFLDSPYIKERNVPVKDLLNQEFFKKVRKDALNGIKNKACDHCWRQQKFQPHVEYRKGFIDASLDKRTILNKGTADDIIRQNINETSANDSNIYTQTSPLFGIGLHVYWIHY